MNQRLWGNEYRTTLICVDSYENGVPVGRFYNPYCSEGVLFHGVMELLKKMETMLDQMSIPQSFSAVRSFAEKPVIKLAEPSGENLHTGKVATFATKILFRQNTSWQGSVSWVEVQREETFRSVLELLLLIDSAINAK